MLDSFDKMTVMYQELLTFYALVVATVMGAWFGWEMNDKFRKWKRLKEQQQNWPYSEEG